MDEGPKFVEKTGRDLRLPKWRRAGQWLWVHWWAVLIGVICVAALMTWRLHDGRPTLIVALVERDAPSANTKEDQRVEAFERLHRETLEDLIQEWNANKTNPFQLLLRKRDLGRQTLDPTELRRRYSLLRAEPNLIAVFDNCWGKDILKIRDALLDFPVPIVFLNADHNSGIGGIPEKEPYGKAKFFVGNSDAIPSQIADLLRQWVGQEKSAVLPKMDDFVFATEEDYLLTQRFEAVWVEKSPTPLPPPSKRVSLRLDASAPQTISDQMRKDACAAIYQAFAHGDSQPSMQARRKLLVLNCHAAWGKELLNWLDSTFENLTVIAYQATLGDDPNYAFGKQHPTNNEMILLSLNPQTIPDNLVVRYYGLQKKYPDDFQRVDAPFFMRRCVISMELCFESLRRLAKEQPKKIFLTNGNIDQAAFKQKMDNLHDSLLSSRTGQYYFDSLGVLLGQNRFLFHKQGTVSYYPLQPNYHAQMAQHSDQVASDVRVPPIIRNAQVGIQHLRVTNINIENHTFHAEFDYWVRVPKLVTLAANSPLDAAGLKTQDEKENFSLHLVNFHADSSEHDDASGNQLPSSKSEFGMLKQSVYSVSGTFRVPDNPPSWRRATENHPGLYPFDRHRVQIELQAIKSDDDLRLSRATKSLEPLGEGEGEKPTVDGWHVTDFYTGINTRETNAVPVPFQEQANSSTQYDTLVLTFSVSRGFLSTFPLIGMPLYLLMGASLAVLYITFGKRNETPTETAIHEELDLEALKSQTELSLGCTLTVITYLISYATLAPRLGGLSYADLLVGFALLFTTGNFIFLVAFNKRDTHWFKTVDRNKSYYHATLLGNWFGTRLELASYRWFASIIYVCVVILWPFSGWLLQHS